MSCEDEETTAEAGGTSLVCFSSWSWTDEPWLEVIAMVGVLTRMRVCFKTKTKGGEDVQYMYVIVVVSMYDSPPRRKTAMERRQMNKSQPQKRRGQSRALPEQQVRRHRSRSRSTSKATPNRAAGRTEIWGSSSSRRKRLYKKKFCMRGGGGPAGEGLYSVHDDSVVLEPWSRHKNIETNRRPYF